MADKKDEGKNDKEKKVEVVPAEQGIVPEEGIVPDYGALGTLQRAEIDIAISTAKRFPRSLKKFRQEMLEMVTLTDKIAEECFYALPRGGKSIEGPSARFAEIAASAWGNCRTGARAISEEQDFVTAQGFFFDVERNVQVAFEVKRRIIDSYGRRYNPDMVGTTTNAACSIALRNAVLKGIPKAFWAEMYEAARKTAVGDAVTLTNRRADMMTYFQKMGVQEAAVCDAVEVNGVEDIGLDELAKLKGIATAIKEGDTTVDQAFPGVAHAEKAGKGTAGLKDKLKEEAQKQPPPPKKETKPPTEKKETKKKEEPPAEKPKPEPAPAQDAFPGTPPPETKPEPEPAPKQPPPDKPPAETVSLVDEIAKKMRASKSMEELEKCWKSNVSSNKELSFAHRTDLSDVYNEMYEKLGK